MIKFFERLKFWWNFKRTYKFTYDPQTGYGRMPLYYNPFNDKVCCRFSRFGMVDGNYDGEDTDRDWYVSQYKPEHEYKPRG